MFSIIRYVSMYLVNKHLISIIFQEKMKYVFLFRNRVELLTSKISYTLVLDDHLFS